MLMERDFTALGFNTTEEDPHFINPRCYGEDVCNALRSLIAGRTPDLTVSAPIQEDYGWGFWIQTDAERYWVAVGWVANESRWRLLADPDRGLNFWKRLFRKPHPSERERIRDALTSALSDLPGVALLAD